MQVALEADRKQSESAGYSRNQDVLQTFPCKKKLGKRSLGSIPFSVCLSLSLVSEFKRVIVTPAVYPRLVEFLHFDIQSTGQKSHCGNTTFWPSQCYDLIRQSDSPCPYQF